MIEETVHKRFIAQKKTLALAESCTGGAIAARLTALPDASQYFLGSVVAYSNEWKEKFLGVDPKILTEKGAVSTEVVEQMVQGILKKTEADYAIAVSGIAGPTGGTEGKPLGTVYIGVGKRDKIEVEEKHFSGDRSRVIEQIVEAALRALLRIL